MKFGGMLMLKIAEAGNTTIMISTRGSENGDGWAVYPHLNEDPTLQGFDEGTQQRIKDLTISGTREKEDTTGAGQQKSLAEAIARLKDTLQDESNRDLGLTAHQIDIEPEGKIAQILGEQYGIKQIEMPTSGSSEIKG